MIHCLSNQGMLMLQWQEWLGTGSNLPPKQGTVWALWLMRREALLLLCSCCNGLFSVHCSPGAPAAPAGTPLARGLEDLGVFMTFQSEVLPQPSCVSGPEPPVCVMGVW